MSDSVRPILVVGSVALDTVHTPTESATDVLGGGASYFCLAGSIFAPIRLVAVVGDDFSPANRALLESRNIDLGGLEVLKGKTFRWTARYSGVRLEERETLDTQLNVFAGFHPVLPAAYRSSRIVFLSNIQPELQLDVLDQVEKADFVACDTIKLWLDTARSGLERVFRRVDCVLVNDEELTGGDELDALPPPVIDRLVSTFRKMYLSREAYTLHGLALVGVRAVMLAMMCCRISCQSPPSS